MARIVYEGPVNVGTDLDDATEAAELSRAVVNSKMMHALLRAERGTHTEASFRAVFGLSVSE